MTTMLIDAELMKILACPQCHGELQVKEAGKRPEEVPGAPQGGQGQLVCQKCKLAYPVRDGIPVMLIEEASKIT